MGSRLIAYNIMAGGVGRADPLAEVLLGRRPDVVGLIEADDAVVLRRLVSRLGFDFVSGRSAGGTVALLSRHRVLDSVNIAAIAGSTMPILDVTLEANSRPLLVRVARVTSRTEADRMARLLANRVPHAMLISYEPPMGMCVIDGNVIADGGSTFQPQTSAPVRRLDQVLLRPDVTVLEDWVEQDRLAYYASDHLPSGAEIEIGTLENRGATS